MVEAAFRQPPPKPPQRYYVAKEGERVIEVRGVPIAIDYDWHPDAVGLHVVGAPLSMGSYENEEHVWWRGELGWPGSLLFSLDRRIQSAANKLARRYEKRMREQAKFDAVKGEGGRKLEQR